MLLQGFEKSMSVPYEHVEVISLAAHKERSVKDVYLPGVLRCVVRKSLQGLTYDLQSHNSTMLGRLGPPDSSLDQESK